MPKGGKNDRVACYRILVLRHWFEVPRTNVSGESPQTYWGYLTDLKLNKGPNVGEGQAELQQSEQRHSPSYEQ